jgi:hypothetical protein
MKHLSIAICLPLMLFVFESSCDAQMRTWHDIHDGEMRGKLISVIEEKVNIKGELRNVSIPFWNLNPNDQLWIRRYMRNRRKQQLIPKVSDFPRQWTMRDGTTFDGQLLQRDNREALIIVSMKPVRFSIKQLSDHDAEYIRDWPGPIDGMRPSRTRQPAANSAARQATEPNATVSKSTASKNDTNPNENASATEPLVESPRNDIGADQANSSSPFDWSAVVTFVLRWRRTLIGSAFLIAIVLLKMFRKKPQRQRVYLTPDDGAQLA